MELDQVNIKNLNDFVKSANPEQVKALFAERERGNRRLYDEAKAARDAFEAGKRMEAERVREQLSEIEAQRQAKAAEIEIKKKDLARHTVKGHQTEAASIKATLPHLCAELTALDEQTNAFETYEITGDPEQATAAQEAYKRCCTYEDESRAIRTACKKLCADLSEAWSQCTPDWCQGEKARYLRPVSATPENAVSYLAKVEKREADERERKNRLAQ